MNRVMSEIRSITESKKARTRSPCQLGSHLAVDVVEHVGATIQNPAEMNRAWRVPAAMTLMTTPVKVRMFGRPSA